MDSINTILGDKIFSEPPEINSLKQFIKDNYQADAVVSISGKTIVISVASAALANSLRLRLPEIKRLLKTDKNLAFRIH